MILGTSYFLYVAQGIHELAAYLATGMTSDPWHGWTGEHP